MDLDILGGILKKIGNFSMKDFNNRLVFQKTVYFMKVFGIDLGYDFSWYIAGPYSSDLAGDGFKLQMVYDNVNKAKFLDEKLNQNFNNFSNFMKNIKKNPHKLELYASIHFLNSLGKNEAQIVNIIQGKKESFSADEIKSGINFLRKEGLL